MAMSVKDPQHEQPSTAAKRSWRCDLQDILLPLPPLKHGQKTYQTVGRIESLQLARWLEVTDEVVVSYLLSVW
jgi:hypothetical protein